MKRFPIIILSIIVPIVFSGCAFQSSQRVNRPPMTPRESAASQLTQEGIGHLKAGRPDNAIRSFEQAMGLNPNNGQCYYYMAQAWLAKGVVPEARQFNSLARDYLKDDARWELRVRKQTDRILRLSK